MKFLWIPSQMLLMLYCAIGAYYKLTLHDILFELFPGIESWLLIVWGSFQALSCVLLLHRTFWRLGIVLVASQSILVTILLPHQAFFHLTVTGICVLMFWLKKTTSKNIHLLIDKSEEVKIPLDGLEITYKRDSWVDSADNDEIMKWLNSETE